MTIELSSLLLPALNHLLSQEPWACTQLQTHAGKIACIDLSLLALRLKVTATGLLAHAPDGAQVNVTIRVDAADLPLLLQDRERAMSYVTLEGDAEFAQTISDLSRQLRWDSEQQLSRLFGDIAGKRIADSGQAVLQHLQRNARALQENLADYFLEENPLLVRPARVSEFGQDVSRTRDDAERLLKRIEKLEKALDDDV